MKNKFFPIIVILLLTGIIYSFSGCQQSANANDNKLRSNSVNESNLNEPYKTSAEWNAYWYQGKAELTSYDLIQSRYGELHQGSVVNIFVTEDFSKSKQVKLDDPSSAGNDKLPVFKFNQSIKFVTGIYPYSMMLSTFQPVDINNYPHADKITASIQEWCGMAFYQMNNRDNKFELEQRSYFEHEGDHDSKIDQVIQEDELWNMIRINPSKLPTGQQSILPGALYLRLAHKPLEPVKATFDLRNENGINNYVIDMPSLNRKLSIRFEQTFPYHILGWEDTYPGIDGKILTTTAVKKKELIVDYWRTHTNDDRALREQLGLPRDAQ